MTIAPYERQMLTLIESEWYSLGETRRPFGVWIRRYSPRPADAEEFPYDAGVPEAVWFLDSAGLRTENVWSWMRFVTVHHLTPYPMGEKRVIPRLGLAGFALYKGGESCYSETVWGPTFGRGWRWRLEEGRLRGRDSVWVS